MIESSRLVYHNGMVKPGFHHRPVNGKFEDPCLLVRIVHERRALLFDAGDLHRLSAAEIYKISDVFVTHTHIDHFIGFDSVLRIVLRRAAPLNVYGPRSVTAGVEGKLKGYSWNLIRDYPTVINVFSYSGQYLTHSRFSAQNAFRRETLSRRPCNGTLVEDSGFVVRAATMDHDIPCLAYALEEREHINIDKDRLNRRGLPVGPWLGQFKKIIRERLPADTTISVAGKEYEIRQLADIASITKGQKICYATDIASTPRNLRKLESLARDSDMFYCEAFFLEEDRKIAVERYHLTAADAGSIARKARARKLVVMHVSPRYMSCPDQVEEEAMREFQQGETFPDKP